MHPMIKQLKYQIVLFHDSIPFSKIFRMLFLFAEVMNKKHIKSVYIFVQSPKQSLMSHEIFGSY